MAMRELRVYRYAQARWRHVYKAAHRLDRLQGRSALIVVRSRLLNQRIRGGN